LEVTVLIGNNMEIIKQYHEIIGECKLDVISNMKLIEDVGRVCYQSQKNKTDDSYILFVENLINRKHLAMVEHSNMIVRIDAGYKARVIDFLDAIVSSNFIEMHYEFDSVNGYSVFFAGNYRAWMEQIEFFGDLKELPNMITRFFDNVANKKATILKEDDYYPSYMKRITVFFKTNRAVTHELVRHRPVSYGQLSQRYVRYSDMEFIQPVGVEKDEVFMTIFKQSCYEAKTNYKNLLHFGYKPQQARNVLPNSIATEIYVTADINEWKHIFSLRCASTADPQMQDLMKPVMNKFVGNGWIK
jgi:thymidylate synthase (FAD)